MHSQFLLCAADMHVVLSQGGLGVCRSGTSYLFMLFRHFRYNFLLFYCILDVVLFGIFACYYERLDEVAFRIWNFEIWNFENNFEILSSNYLINFH